MSLEAVIQENTSALRQLIDIMSSAGGAKETPLKAVPPEKKDADVIDIQSAKTQTAKSTAKQEDAKSDVSYNDAAKAVTTLARTKGRDAAIEVLSQFGVKKLPDVKPEQYASVIEACEKAGK